MLSVAILSDHTILSFDRIQTMLSYFIIEIIWIHSPSFWLVEPKSWEFFHIGSEPCHPFITWPQKKIPHSFRCSIIVSKMVKSVPAPNIRSMPIRMWLPDWNFHARWWIKKNLTFRKLSQMVNPCLIPMVPYMYQMLKSLFFRYLWWMILLHVSDHNKPLQRYVMSNAPPKWRRSMIP